MTSDRSNQWTFRGNYDAARLGELKSCYEALGFSVKTGPMVLDREPGRKPDGKPDRPCTACMDAFPSLLQALYTKKIDSEC